MTIVSIGEILWDVFKDSEKLGGASLNFAVHAGRLGHRVIFVRAVGEDERGRESRAGVKKLGLSDEFIQTAQGAPTGIVTVQVDDAGQPVFTIHRPAAYDGLRLSPEELARIAAQRPDWVNFGTLYQAAPASRAKTRKLLDALPGAQRFYDVNLRRDSCTPALVSELMSTAQVVKLNEDEASEIDSQSGRTSATAAEFTNFWSRKLGWRTVAVTRGAQGCAVRIGEDYAEVAGRTVKVVDTVEAGDAFAAAFLHGLSQGWDAARIG